MSESIHVLHVDDEPNVAEVTADFLEREDDRIKVVTETHVSDGLDRLATEEFDCIISDYDMSEMDGLAFLERVRDNYDDLSFILFTGKGSEEVASKALYAGATDYLQKEVGTDQYTILANRVVNSVETARAKRQRQRQLDAIETAQDGISLLDEDGQFIYVNEAYADLYGYEPEDMIGEHWALIYPDDDVEVVRKEILPTVTDDGEWRGETTGLRADGSTFIEDHTLSTTDDGEFICTVRDITDRKKREQQLQAERNRVAALFESVPEPVVRVRLDEGTPRIQDVNTAFETTFGTTTDEAVGESLNDLIVPTEHHEEADEIDQRALQGVPVEREVRRQAADGLRDFLLRTIPVDCSAAETEFEQFGVYIDITDQKDRERELTRYKEMLNQAGDIVYAADADGYLTAVNDAAVSFLGYDREELLGAHVSKVMDDEDIATGEQRIRELVADPNRTQGTFEMALTTAAGERIQCEDHIHILTSDGEFNGTVGVVRDITERKKRETNLRALHEATEKLQTAETVEEVCSTAVTTAEDVLGLPVTVCWLYEEQEGEHLLYPATGTDQAMTNNPDSFTPDKFEWKIFKTGDAVQYSVSEVNPKQPMDQGMLFPLGEWGLLGAADLNTTEYENYIFEAGKILANHVTLALERIDYLSELQTQKRELQRQNDRLDEFASVVSHDLRNPLNVAQGRLELAKETGDAEHFEAIADAQNRIEGIIEDVLTLARQGAVVGKTQSIALATVARRAWDTVETGTATLQLDIDQTIDGDASRVAQLFENLFRNAIDHGGEDVTVHVGWLEGRTGFYVEDTGPGISPKERAHIFESGYTTDPDGTGFGLAIVTEIANGHGWEIDGTDGEEGGARFEITIESRNG